MSSIEHTEEFKIEAVRLVTDSGHEVKEVADRLGVSMHCLYAWMQRFGSRRANASFSDDAGPDAGRPHNEWPGIAFGRDDKDPPTRREDERG